MEIRVRRIKVAKLSNDPHCRGFADVEINFDVQNWIFVRDWRIMECEDGTLNVEPAFLKWKNPMGKFETVKLISMPGILRALITTAVVAEYRKIGESQGNGTENS